MKKNLLSNKRFMAYATGLCIDRFGNAVYSIVLPLLAYHITKSFIDMGIMAICQFFPRIIFGFIAGPLIDRSKKRNILFKALIFQSFCSFLIALLYQSNSIQMWMLYAVGALLSIGFEFSRTAEISVVPIMFKEHKVDAITNLATIHTIMFIAGPTIGGLLLEITSYGTLLWINSLSYLGPIIFCIWSQIPNEKIVTDSNGVKGVLDDMKKGVQFIKENLFLKNLIILTLFNGAATSGIQTVILFYAKDHLSLSDGQTGLFFGIEGLGMLFGSLFVKKFKSIKREKFLQICLLLNLFASFLFLWPHTETLLLGQLLISMGSFSYLVSMDVIIQQLTPENMLGRVTGLFRLLNYLIFVLSTAGRSLLIDKTSILNIFLLSTILIFLASCLASLYFSGKSEKDRKIEFANT